MLTNEDVKRLIDFFATKQDLERVTENLTTKDDFSRLFSAIDAYAQKADTYFQEMVALAHKVDRLEKWIHQLAEKTGVKLEYF